MAGEVLSEELSEGWEGMDDKSEEGGEVVDYYYYYSSFKVYAVKDYDTYLASQDLLAKNSP